MGAFDVVRDPEERRRFVAVVTTKGERLRNLPDGNDQRKTSRFVLPDSLEADLLLVRDLDN